MNKEYYNKVYIPGIVKWGKITMLLGIITCFGPALVISVIYGCMPPVSAIIAGTIAQISVSGAFYIVEPISYFTVLGPVGTYMAFLSGNISNMRVPCAGMAQVAADVEPGTEKGSIVSVIGMATSIVINVSVLSYPRKLCTFSNAGKCDRGIELSASGTVWCPAYAVWTEKNQICRWYACICNSHWYCN